ncbi:hypothetical protein EV356DRAFT_500259 [Viridothelium virens]|uniref:Uncharacterized protein n=1 Tax=Viridothelium virens TaxID=1048519 RepID=A0A6A6HD30_VIRVR|nr:hypothetical protein EV356DRAFT_500259 [Viridothelium virens]
MVDSRSHFANVKATGTQRAMDAQADDDTQRTASADSLTSGLTSLENETDEFGKRLLQHAKDKNRLNDTLKNNQPFKKARPNTRVALTLENLERNHSDNTTPRANAPLANGHRRSGSSASSRQSDPPVNIPREWGRKGKQGTGWMNRIKTADELVESEDWHHGDTIYPYKTTFTGDDSPRSVDWTAPADVPIPSIEDSSPIAHSRRHSLSPAAIRHRTASLERKREWEMSDDFTVGSLLTSTPAVPARSKALDEVRQREIENLTRRAVASSRLDKIREQSPETMRRPSTAKSFPENEAADLTSRAEDFSMATVHGHSDKGTRSSQANLGTAASIPAAKDLRNRHSNESIRSARYTTPPSTKLAERVSQLTKEAQNQRPSPQRHESRDQLSTQLAESFSKIKQEGHQKRPEHERSDSRELLRQLARVTSVSPSPGKNAYPPAQKSGEGSRASPLSKDESNVTQEEAVDNQPAIEDLNESLPNGIVDGGREQHHPIDPNSLRQADTTTIAKTPRVTGAWIDTPGTYKPPRNILPSWTSSLVPRNIFLSKTEPEPQTTPQDLPASDRRHIEQEEHQQQSRRRLPSSALAAILEDARNMSEERNPSNSASEPALPAPTSDPHVEPPARLPPKSEADTLGDSTIGSLEDIVDPNLDYTDTLDLPEAIDIELRLLQHIQSERQLTQAERDRRQEILTLQAMNANLRKARTSIKDVKRSINRVERHVESTETQTPLPYMHPAYMQRYPYPITFPGSTNFSLHTSGICEKCTVTYPHIHSLPVWLQLWNEFSAFFWTNICSLFWTLAPAPSSPHLPPRSTLTNPFPTVRLTMLSRILLALLIWFILESIVSLFASHIYYLFADLPPPGTVYDDRIPIFPYAIPTLLFNPLYYAFLEPWENIWAPPFYAVYDWLDWWTRAVGGEVEWWSRNNVTGWGYGMGAMAYKRYRMWERGQRWGWDEALIAQRKVGEALRRAKEAGAAAAVTVARMADDEVVKSTPGRGWL